MKRRDKEELRNHEVVNEEGKWGMQRAAGGLEKRGLQ